MHVIFQTYFMKKKVILSYNYFDEKHFGNEDILLLYIIYYTCRNAGLWINSIEVLNQNQKCSTSLLASLKQHL